VVDAEESVLVPLSDDMDVDGTLGVARADGGRGAVAWGDFFNNFAG
jgi:hypothetical protein